MLTLVSRRLVAAVPVLLGVTVLTFLLSHVIPGDPARLLVGQRASDEVVRRMRKELGLDDPLYVQYWNYLGQLLRGDLGTSIRNRRPVIRDLAERFPASLELTSVSLFLCVVMAIPLGVMSAVKRNRLVDHVTRVLALFGVSMPVFWWGLLLLLVFYFRLGWLPGPGRIDLTVSPPVGYTSLYILDSILSRDWRALASSARHLVLPAFCLCYVYLAIMTRMVRSSMLEVLSCDYIRTARANGLPERTVIYKHALRNALAPTVTMVGLSFGELIGGAILTETIFAWPGLGSYMVDSVLFLDFPAIMGCTVLICLVYMIVNLIVDITYGFLDPQVRWG